MSRWKNSHGPNVAALQMQWRFDDSAPREAATAAIRKVLWPKQRYGLMVYRTQAGVCRVLATVPTRYVHERDSVLADGSGATWQEAIDEAVADAKRRVALAVLAGER